MGCFSLGHTDIGQNARNGPIDYCLFREKAGGGGGEGVVGVGGWVGRNHIRFSSPEKQCKN